jgi:hypothetical protein
MDITVLRRRGKEALVKKVSRHHDICCNVYEKVRYEHWYDTEKMEQGIESEEIDGVQHVYVKSMPGISRDPDAVEAFEKSETE